MEFAISIVFRRLLAIILLTFTYQIPAAETVNSTDAAVIKVDLGFDATRRQFTVDLMERINYSREDFYGPVYEIIGTGGLDAFLSDASMTRFFYSLKLVGSDGAHDEQLFFMRSVLLSKTGDPMREVHVFHDQEVVAKLTVPEDLIEEQRSHLKKGYDAVVPIIGYIADCPGLVDVDLENCLLIPVFKQANP
jgi:hypothetical protein